MIYSIYNNILNVSIDSFGAQLISIKTKDNTEYIWQRDPQYWKESSPVIFPYVARLVNKKYFIDKKEYEMECHGFAKEMEYDVNQLSDEEIEFSFYSNDDTLKQYPRKFKFSLIYKLEKNRLNITYKIENKDDKIMHFGFGGHPGFNVPIDKKLKFEDYYLEYENENLKQVEFTEDCFITGNESDLYLNKGRLNLRHDIYDNDAIVVKGGHKVSLKTDKDNKSVTVIYPNMDYLGTWHKVKSDAPYVCIEPWYSLPANKNGKTIFEEDDLLVHLDQNKTYTNTYMIEIN